MPSAAALCDPNTLLLTTIRSHDQYNTTIYGADDRYRGISGRRDVVFMNKQDLAANNLQHGDVIDIQTALPSFEHLRLKGFTAVAYDIARGSVAAYYPEANCLVPLGYQEGSNVMPDLANAMKINPNLKVQLNAGYFDLATPFYQGVYEMHHLPMPAGLQANIEYKFYESGHMVYAKDTSLKMLHDNVAGFIRRTGNQKE